MKYIIIAGDGSVNGSGQVGEFAVGSDKNAKVVFEAFEKNKEYDADTLDLYRFSKNEPLGRKMIKYRWRLITAPGSRPKSQEAIFKYKKIFEL